MWLDAGGLFIALGRPRRNFLHAMSQSEGKELSLKSAMKPADLLCIHTLSTFAHYPWQKSFQILPSVAKD